METQVRTFGPNSGSSSAPGAERLTAEASPAAALPAIVGAEGYVLLPQRIDTTEDAEAVECIARAIADAAPSARQVSFERLRDSLFPWLEPGTKPRDPEDLLALMKRPRLQDRLKTLDIRYFVHIDGRRMDQTPRNHFACTLASCADLTVQKRGSQLSATLLDLREGISLGGRDATAQGTSTTLVVGIIPIMFIAPTGSQVCSDVGTAIAKAFAAGETR